jgi:hypothetical protein
VKGKFFQKISETRISDPSWAQKHWQTLWHNYRKAPYFDLYAPDIQSLYERPFTHLSEVNHAFIELINRFLAIHTKIRWSSEFELMEERNARLIDICQQTGATDYFSGPAAQSYMDLQAFQNSGIQVYWFNYSGYPEYPQLHGPFEHAVTILDLLFNTGESAKNYMKSFNTPETLYVK